MKKEKIVTLRVDADLWDRFKRVAKMNDSDASKEMRKFIKRYLAKNAQLEISR